MSSALPVSSSSNDENLNNRSANTVNVDPSEVEKFNNLASEWWSNTGAFATLHEINPLRLNWMLAAAVAYWQSLWHVAMLM